MEVFSEEEAAGIEFAEVEPGVQGTGAVVEAVAAD